MQKCRTALNTAIVGLCGVLIIGSVSPAEAKPGNGVRHVTDGLVVDVGVLRDENTALQKQIDGLVVETGELQQQIDAITGEPSETAVDCNVGDVLQDAIDLATPFTTFLVSGTCNENISILKEGATIDGQGSASIRAADNTAPTVFINGRGITIRNFSTGSISGGSRGIVVSGSASATIEANNIVGASTTGIAVEGNSFATITGNSISNHGGNGIAVTERSSARIGTSCTPENRNTLSNNGHSGIALSRNSEASILGNAILDHTTNGIFVADGSVADTASNDISGNGGDGVDVRRLSSVLMGSRNTPNASCPDDPNSTDPGNKNIGIGIDCQSQSTVDGELGTLDGDGGAARLRNKLEDCPNCCSTSVDTPPPDPDPCDTEFCAADDNLAQECRNFLSNCITQGWQEPGECQGAALLICGGEDLDEADVCKRESCLTNPVLFEKCETFMDQCLTELGVTDEACVAGGLFICRD